MSGLTFLQHLCFHMNQNKAFVGLGSCDNVQTERSIIKYANWPRLQIKRTGLSRQSVKLLSPEKLQCCNVGKLQIKNVTLQCCTFAKFYKIFHILDLTLAGAVGGLNRLFYAQMRRTTAAAAENRFHFVENGRPEQTNFQKIPTHPTRGSGSISWNAICIYQLTLLYFLGLQHRKLLIDSSFFYIQGF